MVARRSVRCTAQWNAPSSTVARPALRVVTLGETFERLARRSPSLAVPLDHEVELGQLDGDDAVRPLGEVSALPRPGTAHEVELAIDPEGADTRDVRRPSGRTVAEMRMSWPTTASI